MKNSLWEPPTDVDKALRQRIRELYPNEIAALPDCVPLIPEYELRGGEQTAFVTFYFPKSHRTAWFAYRKGEWVMTRDWND